MSTTTMSNLHNVCPCHFSAGYCYVQHWSSVDTRVNVEWYNIDWWYVTHLWGFEELKDQLTTQTEDFRIVAES